MKAHFRLAGAVGAALFWAAVVVTAALTPGYSHVTQMVSELGAIGAPLPWLINWFGIIPFGVSMIVMSAYIALDFRPGFTAWLSGIALCVGGLGFTLAGLMPCDVGCRPSDLPSAALHGLGAELGFLLVPLAGLLLGLRAFRSSPQRSIHAFSLLGALAMATSLVLLLSALDPPRALVGVWQRLTLFFISLWMAGLSLYLLPKAIQGGRRGSVSGGSGEGSGVKGWFAVA